MPLRKPSIPGFIISVLTAVNHCDYWKCSGTWQKNCCELCPTWNHFRRRCPTDISEFFSWLPRPNCPNSVLQKGVHWILTGTRAENPAGDACESRPRSPCQTLQGALLIIEQRQERNGGESVQQLENRKGVWGQQRQTICWELTSTWSAHDQHMTSTWSAHGQHMASNGQHTAANLCNEPHLRQRSPIADDHQEFLQ